MQRIQRLNRIVDTGMVAIVRTGSMEKAVKMVEAIREGGVDIIEITLTTPGALRAIEALCDQYSEDELLLGAGSVLDPEGARVAIASGAQFIVTPNLNVEAIKVCNRYSVPITPGVATPTEMVTAMENGVDVVKVFPGSTLRSEFIKAVRAPLPTVGFIPTGGVSASNIGEWFASGAVAVAAGSNITSAAGPEEDYRKVTKVAAEFLHAVKQAKQAQAVK